MTAWLAAATGGLLALLLAAVPAAAAPREVRVGVYENAPKIMAAGPDGRPGGILGELLAEMAGTEGWTIRGVPCEWQRCLTLLQSGGLDLMPDVAWTEERAQRFDFHVTPALQGWSQLYRRPDVRLDSLLSLQGRRVAVLAGSVQQDYLIKTLAGFGVKAEFIAVSTMKAGFELVQQGGADAAASNRYFGDYFAPQYGLETSPLMFLPAPTFYAVAKGRNDELLESIEAHLQRWQADADSPYYKVLARWVQPPAAPVVPQAVWWGLGGLALALALALGLSLVLRRAVATRTRQLQASEERLRAILDGVDAYIFIKNPARQYEYVNGRVAALFGRPPEAVVGHTDRDFFDGATLAELETHDERVLQYGERVEAEEVLAKPGEPVRHYLTVKLPLRDGSGQVVGLCGVSTDITDRQQAADELLALTRAKAASDAASEAKSLFLANMSHELRTPMNAILGLSHLLRRDDPTPRQAERLARMDAAAHHLLSLINDVLDLAKIEAGRLALDERDFRLAEVLEPVRAIVGELARDKGLALQVAHEGVPEWLHGDPARLRQALLNYAGNAVKFTRQGEIGVCVSRLPAEDGALVLRFEVRDTGVGVSPERLATLFRPFEQADVSTTREFGGTGLGLAITRRLATLMGGETGADSTPGVGSTFWFTARLAPGRGLPPAGPAADPVLAEQDAARHCAGARVLLAEDNAVNQEVAVELLRSVGVAVDLAGDGVQAVAMARHGRWDLVLMDMQMPEMDGVTATRTIRALPGWQDVPIVAMTANVFEEHRQAALAAGMNDFLVKPVDPPTLYRTLMRWLPDRRGADGASGGPAGQPPAAPPSAAGSATPARPPAGPSSGDAAAPGALAPDTAPPDPAPADAAAGVTAGHGRPAPVPTGEQPSPTGPAEGADRLAGLRGLAGLDLDAALAGLGGRAALYERLLRRFLAEHPLPPGPLRAQLAAGEREAAARQAHTLKGLAATLGATSLREAAVALDAAFQAGADADTLLTTAGRLDAAWQQLAAGAGPVLARLPAAAPPTGAP